MNAQTGRAIHDIDHLNQSVKDVLLTPTVSRLMRRDYGSQLFNLIDQAANPATHLRLYAAIAIALLRWEPRLKMVRRYKNALFWCCPIMVHFLSAKIVPSPILVISEFWWR